MPQKTPRHDFRSAARAALQRAKEEIGSNDPSRLRYAALELRMCLEALTYERAQAYGDDFPPRHYETWQPPKVLKVLLDFDELADKSVTLKFRKESLPGEEPHKLTELGTAKVFGLKEISKMHNTLGNFLHYPTLEKIFLGADQTATIRTKCESFVAKLDEVFASSLHNAIFAFRVSFNCSCGAHLKRRVPDNGSDGEAVCYECGAQYDLIKSETEGAYLPCRQVETVSCPAEECGHPLPVPVEKIKLGAHWVCKGCKQKVVFGMCVFVESPQETGS